MLRAFALLVCAAALVGFAGSVSATVLTFEIAGTTGGATLPDTYGDNVTGDNVPVAGYEYDQGNAWTPDIAVEYRTLDSSQVETHSYLRLNNDYSSPNFVAWPVIAAGRAEITFVPAPGASVRINSFELATYLSSPSQSVDTIRITDVTRALDLWTPAGFDGTPDPSQLFTPNYTGATGATIRLQFGHNYNVAFENVNFDQVVVPEPTAAAAAFVLAMTATGLRRRQRS